MSTRATVCTTPCTAHEHHLTSAQLATGGPAPLWPWLLLPSVHEVTSPAACVRGFHGLNFPQKLLARGAGR